jgi:hypothetical protein
LQGLAAAALLVGVSQLRGRAADQAGNGQHPGLQCSGGIAPNVLDPKLNSIGLNVLAEFVDRGQCSCRVGGGTADEEGPQPGSIFGTEGRQLWGRGGHGSGGSGMGKNVAQPLPKFAQGPPFESLDVALADPHHPGCFGEGAALV